MKRVSPRIGEATEAWLSENFGSLGGGAEYILESTAAVYKRTVAKIKATFDTSELSLMLDCMNGTILTPGIAGQIIGLNVADSIDLDKTDEKWGVDRATIVGKLEGLSIPELALLEIWCQGFWEQHEHGSLEDYIK